MKEQLISILKLKSDASEEDVIAAVKSNLDSITELNETLEAINKEMEANRISFAKKGIKIASAKEIDAKVAACFKQRPEAKKVFVTIDGTCFLEKNHADNHKRDIGGIVKEFDNKKLKA